jgi:hypothetical protein
MQHKSQDCIPIVVDFDVIQRPVAASLLSNLCLRIPLEKDATLPKQVIDRWNCNFLRVSHCTTHIHTKDLFECFLYVHLSRSLSYGLVSFKIKNIDFLLEKIVSAMRP